jgi:hypothetical protein
MASVARGTALTCGHEGCNCQIRIDEVCNCPGGGDHYTCRCGSALTEKSAASDVAAGTVLTCGHEGCNCAVRIEVACNCPGGGADYVCICGSRLVEKVAA